MNDITKTKSLNDVMADMSQLYEAVKTGDVDVKLASELANITGKYLKAVQLDFAKEVFASNKMSQPARSIEHAANVQ